MNNLKIRNSTSEFLIFTADNMVDDIEVRVDDETVWLTQKMLCKLFDKSRPTILEHLDNLYNDGELDENSVCRKFLHTEKEKTYNVKFYNLTAIIAIGFKVNSKRAIEFRKWANNVLHNFSIKGYVLDKERLKNGTYLNEAYFDELLIEIREIRASERKFYQKITDIYATAFDYNKNSEITQTFFKQVQNKMHYAIHGDTAAEVLMNRANADKSNMGLTTWKKTPEGKIQSTDVVIAKNYLTKEELKQLEQENKNLMGYIKTIFGVVKGFFKEILHIGNNESKDRVVSEIKDFYDNKDFKQNDVYDMTKATTKEKELFDYAKIDKNYKKGKDKGMEL